MKKKPFHFSELYNVIYYSKFPTLAVYSDNTAQLFTSREQLDEITHFKSGYIVQEFVITEIDN